MYKKTVVDLLKASGVDLSNGGGFKELSIFRKTFRTAKLCFVD